MYKATFENATYYIPSCSDPPQTLFRYDGSLFNLTCAGIGLDNGEVIATPTQWSGADCQNVTVNNGTACFAARWPDLVVTDGTVPCVPPPMGKRDDVTGAIKNLTEIADQLAKLTNMAKSAAGGSVSQGLSVVGCAAEASFQATVAYYFAEA